ncbi:LptF/LptG family permease [candidate division KSB1 bacterium]|nr:LptF/LptG family permease [candidate division KSB1 bacterium]
MFILWRYIIKEHIGPFIFSLCVITLVFLLNLVFRELPRILSRGLPLGVVIEYFSLNMAWIVALAVPMAVLVAALMAFGRFSGDNEVIAMKASGIAITRIIMPVFILSILIALFLIWFNNHVLPDFNHRARLLASDIGRKRPTLALEPGVIYRDLPGYTMLVKKIIEKPDTAYVDSVYIDDYTNPNATKFISANQGKIYLNRNTGLLTIILYNGYMHELDLQNVEQYRRLKFPKQILAISVPDMILERSNSEYRGDREKSAAMMNAEIAESKKEIAIVHQRVQKKIKTHFMQYLDLYVPVADSSESVGAGSSRTNIKIFPPFDRIKIEMQRLQQEVRGELNFIDSMERKIYRLSVEVQKKYSIPVACMVFVLIGAPLGIMSRRGSLAMAGGTSFAFFLLYWSTLIGGEELADNRYISPFMAMWLANIIVGISGVYLVFHSIHEATGQTLLAPFIKIKKWLTKRNSIKPVRTSDRS